MASEGNKWGDSNLSGPVEDVPQKKSSTMRIVLIVLLIVGVLGGISLAICCGVVYWRVNQVHEMVMNQLKDNPVVLRHLGEVSSYSFNFQESQTWMEETQTRKRAGMAYDVSGPRGTGVLYVEIEGQGNNMVIVAGSLKMSTGEKYDLVAKGGG